TVMVAQYRAGYVRKHIGPLLGERSHGASGDHAAALVGHRALASRAVGQRPDPPGTPHAETTQAETAARRDLLTLELVPLGTGVWADAHPGREDSTPLQQLVLDAAPARRRRPVSYRRVRDERVPGRQSRDHRDGGGDGDEPHAIETGRQSRGDMWGSARVRA